jgi:DNA-binding XRE family transcriptional regulator
MSEGKRIRAAREAAGYSQKQLADLAGCSQADVHRLENGQVLVSKHLAKILSVLNLTNPAAVMVPVVGYIGAGSEVLAIDDHAKGDGLDHIPAPPGMVNGIALIVRGDSMAPKYDDGEVLFIEKTVYSIDSLIGEHCYIQLPDGRCYVKKLQYGSRPGLYSLISYNAPAIMDVPIERAYPIAFTKPRYRNLK